MTSFNAVTAFTVNPSHPALIASRDNGEAMTVSLSINEDGVTVVNILTTAPGNIRVNLNQERL